VDKGLEAINRIMPALFQLPGCLVKSTKSDILITFQDGIFSGGGLKIDKEGRAQLARVAEFLSANAPEFWLIVEGQTNTQPLRSGSPYRDNYTLGLRRAVAATEVVRNDSKFPSDRLMASSAGGNPPPFEMTQPGAESKNRTVRFRLIPKIGGPSDTQ
jgi:flagellar motor protein MotB